MIGCIFAENGPLEGGIFGPDPFIFEGGPPPFSHIPSASFWGTGWGAKGDFRRIFDPFIFEGGLRVWAQKVFQTESFWGTGWGAKGDFMRYSYLYPYIWPREPIRYTHSKVGNDQMHIRGEMTSGKLTLSGFVRRRPGSLWWFEVDFWPRSVHFRRGPPTIFRKHMPSGMGTESLGVIGCIFAENGPLEDGIEASFWGTGWGAKGDFRRIFGPDPFIFEGGPPPFSESTCPQVWAQKVWEWLDVYSRRMGP